MNRGDLDDIATTIEHWFNAKECRSTIVAAATELHCPPSRHGMRRAMIEYLIDQELGTGKNSRRETGE